MKILTVYKKVLQDTVAVSGLVNGGVWIGRAQQGAARPYIILEMPEEGQEYSHSGPAELMDAHIVVTCRADTDRDAAVLGEAVVDTLKAWAGTEYGHAVALTEHFKSSHRFDDTLLSHDHVSEYTSFYRKV